MSIWNKVECACCHTFVTPIYDDECPNCGGYVSGFDPEEEIRREKEEYERDYLYLKSRGMSDEEIEEILGGYNHNEEYDDDCDDCDDEYNDEYNNEYNDEYGYDDEYDE